MSSSWPSRTRFIERACLACTAACLRAGSGALVGQPVDAAAHMHGRVATQLMFHPRKPLTNALKAE